MGSLATRDDEGAAKEEQVMRRFKVTVDDKTYDVAVEEVGEVPPATPKAALALSASAVMLSRFGSMEVMKSFS